MSIFKNKKNVLYTCIVLCVLLIAFLIDRNNVIKEAYNNLTLDYQDNIEVEYGSIFNPLDYVSKDELEINHEVNTYEVGEYNLSYTLKGKTKRYGIDVERVYNAIVKIIDTSAPIIELEKEILNVYLNSEYDLRNENIISISDVVDGDILDYEVISDLDTNTLGTYNVNIKATDKNGLSDSKSYTINVINKPRVVSGGNYSEVYDYLTNVLGYGRATACGILANIRFESNFNPGADSGTYFGLCQWGGGRRSNLFAWCENNGYDAYSVEGQLQYMQHELLTSYTKTYNSLISVEESANGAFDAATIFCRGFEGAATDAGRGDLAYSYY